VGGFYIFVFCVEQSFGDIQKASIVAIFAKRKGGGEKILKDGVK